MWYSWHWIFLGFVPRSISSPLLLSSWLTPVPHQCPLDKDLLLVLLWEKEIVRRSGPRRERTLGISSPPPPFQLTITFLAMATFFQIHISYWMTLLQGSNFEWSPCNIISSPCPISLRSGKISFLLLVYHHFSLLVYFTDLYLYNW